MTCNSLLFMFSNTIQELCHLFYRTDSSTTQYIQLLRETKTNARALFPLNKKKQCKRTRLLGENFVNYFSERDIILNKNTMNILLSTLVAFWAAQHSEAS